MSRLLLGLCTYFSGRIYTSASVSGRGYASLTLIVVPTGAKIQPRRRLLTIKRQPVLPVFVSVDKLCNTRDSQNPLVVFIAHSGADLAKRCESASAGRLLLKTHRGRSPDPSSSCFSRRPQSKLEILPVLPPFPHHPPRTKRSRFSPI